MVMQKPSKIRDIEQRNMNFGVPTVLNHPTLHAKYEQNLLHSFRDRQPAPQHPPQISLKKAEDGMP